MIYKKCQVLFSLKNNKTNIRLLSAANLHSALKVKKVLLTFLCNGTTREIIQLSGCIVHINFNFFYPREVDKCTFCCNRSFCPLVIRNVNTFVQYFVFFFCFWLKTQGSHGRPTDIFVF